MPATDMVLQWNAIAIEATKIDHGLGAPGLQFGPTRASRALAIVQVAVFDAVNSIDQSSTPYLIDLHAPRSASIDAAVAEAAHDTLVSLYPYQKATFDQALASSLQGIPLVRAVEGVIVGHVVANYVLAVRSHDGSQKDAVGQPVNYTYGQDPGQWRPDPLHPDATPLTPDWGSVTPFGIQSATQFGAPPPPSITSKEYADAYLEVKSLGGGGVNTPTTRTDEQTVIGLFWGYDAQPGLCAPVRFYNQIAEVIAKQRHNTEVENARFFALVNVAMADAAITCWNDKYRYNYWRPVTAIRENDPGTGPTGLGSGNPFLVGQGDPTWQPLGAPADNDNGTNFTPPFPSYTSGHATIGAALFRTMADFYGTDNIHFTIVSDEFNTITVDQNGDPRPLIPRSYDSFSQAAEENGMSRIYLGIHWVFDKVQGIKCGDNIGDYDFAHYFRPAHHHRDDDENEPTSDPKAGQAGATASGVGLPGDAHVFTLLTAPAGTLAANGSAVRALETGLEKLSHLAVTSEIPAVAKVLTSGTIGGSEANGGAGDGLGVDLVFGEPDLFKVL